MTPEELISEHTKIKDYLAAESKRFTEHCKPANERLQEIENQLLAKLNEMNAGKSDGKRASIATESGTAYLATIVTPKVENREKFLDWVLDHWDDYGDMLQIGAPQKAAVEQYTQEHDGQLPPFVQTSSFTRVNIRRS